MYYFFDFHGSYLGYMDTSGQFFDPSGNPWAHLVGGREVQDSSGAICGVIDLQGCFFAADGSCRGYLRDAAASPPMELR